MTADHCEACPFASCPDCKYQPRLDSELHSERELMTDHNGQTCRCACHNGLSQPCDEPGGCGARWSAERPSDRQETAQTHDPVTKVAQSLTAIVRLAQEQDLADQAINDANDREIPGGDALVARTPVASPQAWERTFEQSEANGDASHVLDEDEASEPPLQTLLFWSEQWREERNHPLAGRPTIESEVTFIRESLRWAWENELHFNDFAEDMRKVVGKLEAILYAGNRGRRGVQCFCGADLIRQSWDPRVVDKCEGHDGVCVVPHDHCPHDRGGLRDEWKCQSCGRVYDPEDYALAVSHAHYALADYLKLDEAASRSKVKPGTIKVWASRGLVRKKRDQESGRMLYNVPDIEARHANSEEVA